MIKVILYIAMSLDGFIADEKGNVDWITSGNQNEDYGFASFYQTVDVLMMGSKTYEKILTYKGWPYTDKKTIVFTQRPLTSQHENIRFVADDINTVMDKMREENLRMEAPLQIAWLVGGSKLITSFYNQGLIDEYIITIIPKELKKGILLPIAIRNEVGLMESNTKFFYDGVVQKYFINTQ